MDNFSLKIHDGIREFGLINPKFYRAIAQNSDYFDDISYPWEQMRELKINQHT